jgi:tetratricopeptide (TPR) repeat protein
VAEGDIEAALRMAGAIWRFWQIHGHVREGEQWMRTVLGRSSGLRTSARAKALWGAGWLSMVLGDLDQAHACFAEGAATARALEDRRYLGLALHGIGAVTRAQGQFEQSRSAFEESLPLLQASDNTQDVAWTFEHLGVTALEQGQLEQAVSYLSRALGLFQSLEQHWACGEALTFLGHAALQQGNYAQAQARYEAALDIYLELEDRPNVAMINSYIGAALFGKGDLPSAVNRYKENLVHAQDMKDYWGMVWGVERLAEAAEKLGQPVRAARLWGAAAALRQSTGVLWHPGFHSCYTGQQLVALQSSLGPAAWERLWAEGQALEVDQIVACALEVSDPPAEAA